MTVRVTTYYADGRYTLDRAHATDDNYVEITDAEWEAYQLFAAADAHWYSQLREWDNTIQTLHMAEMGRG